MGNLSPPRDSSWSHWTVDFVTFSQNPFTWWEANNFHHAEKLVAGRYAKKLQKYSSDRGWRDSCIWSLEATPSIIINVWNETAKLGKKRLTNMVTSEICIGGSVRRRFFSNENRCFRWMRFRKWTIVLLHQLHTGTIRFPILTTLFIANSFS